MVTLQQSVYAHTLGSLSRANSFARALWHVCIYTHLLLTTVIASTFGIAMDAPSGTVYARVITSQAECILGRASAGRVGDILLGNERIQVIITSIEHVHHGAASGGNIIDATLVGGQDDFDQMLLFLGRYPRQGRYESINIVKDGSDGTAVVKAEGVDSQTGTLKLTTYYILHRGENYVTVRTTVRNEGSKPLRKFRLGDALEWGYARAYAPNHGYKAANATITADWLAGKGAMVAYGWCTVSGGFTVISGASWSDPIAMEVDIAPAEEITYERYFIIARDIAEVAVTAYRIQKRTIAVVRGYVCEHRTERPIAGATVTAYSPTKQPFVEASVKRDGSFSIAIPPGRYRLLPHHVARRAIGERWILALANRTLTVKLHMSGEGLLRFRICDARTGEVLPGRLTFIGVRGTPTPDFGPSYLASGALNVVASLGRGERYLPPGWYRIIASRGFEYSIDERIVYVRPNRPLHLRMRLRRVVNTRGWLSVDLHQHCEHSFDSSVSLRDRIISNLAEGVEFFVSTDHDYVTDYTPTINAMHVAHLIKSAIGQEITTRHIGHFNVFPLPFDASQPDGGAIKWHGKTAQQIFDEVRRKPGVQVIQVNHPRIGNSYFNVVKLDPNTGTSTHPQWTTAFDCIEVLNAKILDALPQTLTDWFHLLNRGFRFTATGGSDSHHVALQEPGYPRNYVYVGNDNPTAVTVTDVVRALRTGRVIVSMGPFVTMTINKCSIGGILVQPSGVLKMRIRIQSASWVDISEVHVIANGKLIQHFEVNAPPHRIVKFDRMLILNPQRDTWYVVLAYGHKPLSPVVSDYVGYDGTRYPVTPFAVTNPIWVDRDGNGRFDAPDVTTIVK